MATGITDQIVTTVIGGQGGHGAHGVAAGDTQGYYLFILLFLLSAAVFVPLFQRFRISGVLGFLLVGILLGPEGLGRLADVWPVLQPVSRMQETGIQHLAELGVVFLMFSIGLELTLDRLKAMRKMVFGLGASQVVLCAAVLMALFVAFGQSLAGSVMLGMALALSSTAVVVPVLADRKALHTSFGRSVFAILLAQDMALAPILVAAAALTGAAGAAAANGLGGLLALIPALLGLAALLFLGRWGLRPLFNLVAMTRSRELFMAACLLVVLLSGQISVWAGLSMGLGAFVGGVLLGETEYRREVEVLIEPFKGLLLGLFFVTVGARLDIGAVMAHPVFVIGVAAVLILIKAVIIFPLARAFGLSVRAALETALVLGPAGEFAFVIIDEAISKHVIADDFAQAVILSAIVSLFCIPVLASVASRLGRVIEPKTPEILPSEAPQVVNQKAQVIVVGYGRVGALVAEMLAIHDIAYTVVDFNPKVCAVARTKGVEAWYGDASRPDLLERLGVARVRAVVVTASSATFTDQVVKAVRAAREDVHIIARARDAGHAHKLYQMGATDAVPETIEASLQLAENTLIDLGVPMGFVLASIHERRDAFRKSFGLREGSGDLRRALAGRDKPRSS